MSKKNPSVSSDDLAGALSVVEQFLAERAVSDVDRANFVGSAMRVARMYKEMAWHPDEIAEAIAQILKVAFPVGDSEEPGMIIQGPIVLNSMCPHHFMPVRYNLYMSYLPKQGGSVLGLSKLARIPEYLSKRFVLQEQLAKDVADVFYKPANMGLFEETEAISFESDGAIAMLIGTHTCESCRGVNQDARTMVTERRGLFLDDATMEQRFLQAVSQLRVDRPFGG